MLCKVTHCAGRISANTRPHQLRWGDREMGAAIISCVECSQVAGLHAHPALLTPLPSRRIDTASWPIVEHIWTSYVTTGMKSGEPTNTQFTSQLHMNMYLVGFSSAGKTGLEEVLARQRQYMSEIPEMVHIETVMLQCTKTLLGRLVWTIQASHTGFKA